jgi:hypothetical protein
MASFNGEIKSVGPYAEGSRTPHVRTLVLDWEGTVIESINPPIVGFRNEAVPLPVTLNWYGLVMVISKGNLYSPGDTGEIFVVGDVILIPEPPMTIVAVFDNSSEVMNTPTLSGDWDGDHSIALTFTDNSITGDITLTWKGVPAYTYTSTYDIYRDVDGAGFVKVHTTAAGATSWTDTNLAARTYKYYGVPYFPATGLYGEESNITTNVLVSPILHYDLIRTQVNGETPPENYSYDTISDNITWSEFAQLYEDLSAGIIATELTDELYRYYQVRGDDGSTQTSWSNAITTQITMGPFDANAIGGHTDITSI